jgi:hypothetical protein
MSQQGVIGFLNSAAADASIMDQVMEVAQTSDDPAAAITNYAADLGFEVTGPEFTSMVDKLAQVESGELSLNELETVAGGADLEQQSAEMDQSFNLQYLQLQQDMQAQNRQFTLISNIMKVKHDTAKNAINNIR